MATNIEINTPSSSGTYSAYYPKTSIGNIVELARKKSTTYAIHDVAYHASLPAGRFLECTTAGTTSSSNLTLSSTTEGTTTTDGTVVWTVRKINGIFTTANLVAYNTNPLRLKSSTHGIIFRLDESAFYVLLTDANNPDGNFNNFRPIRIDLTTGKCYIDGNISTATALKNAREIDGVTFDGSASVAHYASCATAAATTEKAVTCTNFKLVTGARMTIKFGHTNTANNPTLNVNSTGAKPIYYRGSNIPTEKLIANHVYEFVYNGTNYELVGDLDTTYSTFVKSGATAKAGLVPAPATYADKVSFLREDGTWVHPTRGRRANSDYSIGEVVCNTTRYTYPPYQLVCLKSGTTLDGDLPARESNLTTYGSIIYDGTVVWGIDNLTEIEASEIHNACGRTADITSYYESGLLSTNIRNAKFMNVYPGDYIIKSVTLPAITYTNKLGDSVTQAAKTFNNVKWYVGSLDYFHAKGDASLTTHHILLIASTVLQTSVCINSDNSASGGYANSEMWTVHMANWTNAIKNAFGNDHVLKHRLPLTSSADLNGQGWNGIGYVNGYEWNDVYVNIPSESMFTGTLRVSSNRLDSMGSEWQLPLFANKQKISEDSTWSLTSSICNKSLGVHADKSGSMGHNNLDLRDNYVGIRPYFLFY